MRIMFRTLRMLLTTTLIAFFTLAASAQTPSVRPTKPAPVPRAPEVHLMWKTIGGSPISILRSATGCTGPFTPIISELSATTRGYVDFHVTIGTTYGYYLSLPASSETTKCVAVTVNSDPIQFVRFQP